MDRLPLADLTVVTRLVSHRLYVQVVRAIGRGRVVFHSGGLTALIEFVKGAASKLADAVA